EPARGYDLHLHPLLDQNQIARAHQVGNLAGLLGRDQVAGLDSRASEPAEERERCQHQNRSESGAHNPPCRAWPCPAKLRPETLSYDAAEPREILNRQAPLPEAAARAFPKPGASRFGFAPRGPLA